MAEEGMESRFVCKLCCRKFPCGKSLGGHMRSHVVAKSAEYDEKVEFSSMKKIPLVNVNESKFGETGNGQSGYGLRENPKKTWRAGASPEEKVCRQCGKGFQSLKALCGHMACHSDKEKGSTNTVLDSQSDTEAKEKRVITTRSSKSRKCKKDSPFTAVANNGSSSVSEVDGQEQEELAKCLMMLSRDSGTKCGDSSDNNSVVLETKSSSIEMVAVEKNEVRKLGDGSLEYETARMEDSDSGYFLDECAKAESDVSVDWFKRNGPYMSLKLIANDDYSRKRKHSYANQEESAMKSKYECFNCGKIFKSYQALGGHRPCHKTINNESGENSLENNAAYYKTKSSSSKRSPSGKNPPHLAERKSKSKKNKAHVCPFCDRVFKNGQALGGHKRSHFLNHRIPVEKSQPDLLDLNLPPPEADQEEDGGRFFTW